MCFQGKDRLNKKLGKGAHTYPIIAPKEGDHNFQILVEFLLVLTFFWFLFQSDISQISDV